MRELSPWDKQHLKDLERYSRQIDRIYTDAVREAAAISALVPGLPPNKPFSFADYPATSKRVDKLLKSLKNRVQVAIVNGIDAEWTLANNKNSELANRVFGDDAKKLSPAQYRRYFSTNDKAREAFIARKIEGLSLSDRVWNYTDQFKEEIEMGLDLGIRNGLSADELSRDLRGYLKYPDKLFRRVRDEHGQLHLSSKAKAFHPGAGVYRSSYKNARRLAATETNIAYRTSDYLRWQQLDFVVGIEIRLSNNHTLNGVPFTDICDDLKGKYPKDFKFSGWHPLCRCHAIPILKTEEEMVEDERRMMAGEPLTGESKNRVGDVPDRFKTWAAENRDRIERAKALPYFMRDNEQYFSQVRITDAAAKGVKEAQTINMAMSPKLTVQEISAARHAARTPKKVAEINERWRKRIIAPLDTPIKGISDVQGILDRYLKYYPEETNFRKITVGTYANAPSARGFSMMRAFHQTGTIEFNTKRAKKFGYEKDSPKTRLIKALEKTRKGKSISFDEEYAIESFYHEILHLKAKQWRPLNPHRRGDFKRTAMETINQFVSRHDYQNFIKRLGGKADHHDSVLNNGTAYSVWVTNLRNFLKKANIDETKTVGYFRDKLLNNPYDSLDDELYGFIKDNSKTIRSKSEVLRMLEGPSTNDWKDFLDNDVL